MTSLSLEQGDDCQVLIMAIGGKPPKSKDGTFTFTGSASLEIRSRLIHEAVNQRKEILGEGKWFSVFGDKGDKITIRPVKPPKTEFAAAEIKKARRKTRVVVADQERHDSGPVDFGASHEDGTLANVINSLLAIQKEIPEAYRASARCEIDSASGYEDSHYAHVEISYERPETDEEVIARLTEESVEAMLKERKDRAQFERLSERFSP